MQGVPINGLKLYFEVEDQDSVELIRQASTKSIRLIQENWGLEAPKDCRIYIMTSWLGFMFHSSPWHWKVLLAVTMPLWAFRAKRIWPLAGGWEQRYGNRRTVGVKPPRLLQLADKRIGNRFFVNRVNIGERVQSITCHELTHAFTSHLRLPTWLNEGLAMVTVDKFFEQPTVRHETLEELDRWSDKHNLVGRKNPRVGDEDALVELYVRGYWLTRYIEETRPGLLKDLLVKRYQHNKLEGELAMAYGKSLERFWDEINRELVPYFKLVVNKERGPK